MLLGCFDDIMCFWGIILPLPMLLDSQSWKSWGTGEMGDGVIFDAVYVQGCIRSCSPACRRIRQSFSLPAFHSRSSVVDFLGKWGGLCSSYSCCATWALHQTEQQQCPAFPPSLPPSVHRHIRCCSLHCYADEPNDAFIIPSLSLSYIVRLSSFV